MPHPTSSTVAGPEGKLYIVGEPQMLSKNMLSQISLAKGSVSLWSESNSKAERTDLRGRLYVEE